MKKAADGGMERYRAELGEKISFLEYLLSHYNDGRKKSFFCVAVNLLELSDLSEIKNRLEKLDEPVSRQDRIKTAEALFYEKAKAKNIDLGLRK
jgi:hypothetical protein